MGNKYGWGYIKGLAHTQGPSGSVQYRVGSTTDITGSAEFVFESESNELRLTGTLNASGDVVPATNNTHNLGTPAKKWSVVNTTIVAASNVTASNGAMITGHVHHDNGVSTFDSHVTASKGVASGGDVFPSADSVFNLGSATRRWANIFTGDLHLKNDRGDWTIIEETDYLSLRNNSTGKRYKILMQEIDE